MTAYYDPSVFNVRSIRQAKDVILTKEDADTDIRWERETPYLAELMGRHIDIRPHHQILDYGCGVGRLSIELIKQYGCNVVGVDSSVSMLSLSVAYVENQKFVACPPHALGRSITPCDHALFVWVLQHILSLDDVLSKVESVLQPGGMIFVVDGHHRCLPSSIGKWVDDGKSVRGAMQARFTEVKCGKLDPDGMTPATAANAYWAIYQRKD